MGISKLSAAAIETPWALPNFNIDWTFLPKKGASIAIKSGLWDLINSDVFLNIFDNLTLWSSLFGSLYSIKSINSILFPWILIIPNPIMFVPGSIPIIIELSGILFIIKFKR